MTKTARIFLVAMTLMLAACQVELYQGLSQREANEMVAVLARAGIQAKREQTDPTTFRIMVAEDALADAVEALKRAGLPREHYQSLGEIFPGDGLIVSPYEQRIRTMHALSQEIGRTITSISGVMSARVHIVLPDLDLRGLPMNTPSASVLVHHAPELDTSELATRIRLLVANAVQGMNFRDVAVAFFPLGDAPEPQRRAAPTADVALPPVEAGFDSAASVTPAHVAAPTNYLSWLLWFAAFAMTGSAAALALRDRMRRKVRRAA